MEGVLGELAFGTSSNASNVLQSADDRHRGFELEVIYLEILSKSSRSNCSWLEIWREIAQLGCSREVAQAGKFGDFEQ